MFSQETIVEKILFVPVPSQHHNTQDIFENTRRGLIRPVVAVFVISIAVILALSVFSVRSLDKISEEKSVRLANSVLADIERKLTDLSFEYAYWDQAVDNLVYAFDPVWARENLGPYVYEVYGIDISFVVDQSNTVTYASIGGEQTDETSLLQINANLQTLISQSRTSGPRDEKPVTVSGFVLYGEQLYFAASTLMTTYKNENDQDINTSTDSVQVLMIAMNDVYLADLADRYLLTDLQFTRPKNASLPPTSLVITDVDGVRIGAFRWTTDLPGTKILYWLLPAAVVMFLAMAGLVFLFIHRATEASRAFMNALIGRHEAELEHRLSQVQKMQALGVMVGGVAHNFNNLLQPILMLSLTLRKRTAEDSPDRADLNVMIQACEKAVDLVNQISEFAHQKNAAKGEGYNVYDAVDQGCRLAASTMPSSITLITHLDKQAGAVLLDAVEMQTVMMNLISNAIDSMAGQIGELRVSLTQVLIIGPSEELPPNIAAGTYAKLTVRDTGTGMDEDTLKQIYDPFFTTKSVGRGMGLGLSSTYGIVTRRGGAIQARSIPSKGSTFEVYFPIVDKNNIQSSSVQGSDDV